MSTFLAGQKASQKPSNGFFSLFSNQAQKEEHNHKTIDETIMLLKRAQKTIEKAERVIIEQTTRIQSLEDRNTIDEKTGFLNARGFQKAFQRERSRLQRDLNRNALIVLIEMENFDFIKSKYGKRVGEASLRLISNILREEMREMDSVGRVKQAEFALLFAGASTDISLDRTQRLAMKINRLSMNNGTKEIPISASIRLQDFNPNTTFETLF